MSKSYLLKRTDDLKARNFWMKLKGLIPTLLIYMWKRVKKLNVFDRNGVYLRWKKIGENNSKAKYPEADNEVSVMRNQTIYRALSYENKKEFLIEYDVEKIQNNEYQEELTKWTKLVGGEVEEKR